MIEFEEITMILKMLKENENKYNKCKINVNNQMIIKVIIKSKQQLKQ